MNDERTPCRQIRLALGLTQKEFAEQLGVAKQTIVDIEGRRGAYAKRISLRLARRMAVISGARAQSLRFQDGTAEGCQPVDGKYEVYSEDYAARWKDVAQGRNFSEDGPHPLIGEAVWTVASALAAADEQGPLRAAVLWEELRDTIDKQRNPKPGKPGLALGSAMARHTSQRAKLRRGILGDGLEELHPLTLLKLASQEEGKRLLTICLITRTAAQLASSQKSSKEVQALMDAADLLRKRGLALLRGNPSPEVSDQRTRKQTKKAATRNSTRKTAAPRRRR
jgi:DNA-binding XRE family transcriptional regulator